MVSKKMFDVKRLRHGHREQTSQCLAALGQGGRDVAVARAVNSRWPLTTRRTRLSCPGTTSVNGSMPFAWSLSTWSSARPWR